MRIAITGASGLLGSNVAVVARAAGHEVRALRRRGSQVEHLEPYGFEWAEADLADESALGAAFRGCDVVVHSAAAVSVLRKPTPALREANVEGTRRVLGAARAAGVARVVHVSSVVAVGLAHGSAPADESSRWDFPDHGMADGYCVTKHEAEQVALTAAKDQDVVVVNPSYMFGPLDARPSSGQMIVEVARGLTRVYTPGVNDYVDVRDVARSILVAADRGRRGERYILSGHSRSYREIFTEIAALVDGARPRWSLPHGVAAPLGWIGDRFEDWTGREPLLNGPKIAYGYCADYRFSHAKATAELGHAPGPLDVALRDAVAWLRDHGKL